MITSTLTRALQSLPVEPVEEGPAVVAPGEPAVGVDLEAVRDVDIEPGVAVGLERKKKHMMLK